MTGGSARRCVIAIRLGETRGQEHMAREWTVYITDAALPTARYHNYGATLTTHYQYQHLQLLHCTGPTTAVIGIDQ